MIRADEHPLRQVLFAELAGENATVRLVLALHRRLGHSRMAAALVATYGLRAWALTVPRRPGGPMLAVSVFANARRATDRLATWIAPEPLDRAVLARGLHARTRMATGLLALIARPRYLARALRLMRRVNERHAFHVSCRVAATLACYGRARRVVPHYPRGVVVSSATNPEEAGFAAAARSRHLPVVFISHALPTPNTPALDFTLSILEGEAALDAHRRLGPVRGAVVFAGLDGPSAPLDPARLARPSPSIGIFLPKIVSHPVLARAIDDLRQRFRARAILVRPHPDMIGGDVASGVRAPGVEVTSGREPLERVAAGCDFVVASIDSNVHLPVLRAGIPTVAVAGLRAGPGADGDLFGFRSGRIVFFTSSIGDLDLASAQRFYAGDWVTRFRQFDAAYLRTGTEVSAEVVTALHRATGA